MKTKHLLLLIFALASITFTSCEKDKYPQIYIRDSCHLGEIKGYTNSVEIKNDSVITDFINRRGATFWLTDYECDCWQTHIQILSESKAKIIAPDTTTYHDIVRENGAIYFKINLRLGTKDEVEDSRLKYPPLYFDKDFDDIEENEGVGTGGVSRFVWIRYLFVESKDELYIPYLSFAESITKINVDELINGDNTSNYSGYSSAFSGYNNAFNTVYLNRYSNYDDIIDTMVYQNNKIIFRRIK